MRDWLTPAIELLRTAIQPGGEVQGVSPGNDGGVVLRLRSGKGPPSPPLRLRAESAAGWLLHGSARPTTIHVIARVKANVIAALRNHDVNFICPPLGIVRIWLPTFVLDRSDLSRARLAPAPETRVDPFSDRASLVIRAIVAHPDRDWTTRALAAEVGISTMTASYAIRRLGELGILTIERVGRANRIRLADLRRLVDRWVTQYEWRQNEQTTIDAPIGDPARFLGRLKKVLRDVPWALTLHAGASLVAPHARWDKIHAYVDVDPRRLAQILAKAGWGPGEGKLVLLRPYYQSAWYGARSISTLPVVSDLQLILDLWNYPERGLEQAEHLLHLLEKKTERNRQRLPG